ncbi:MAG: hypothetical protein QNJ46_10425 [Leptolyngbyaceae cyanobacterium MO_188.B28]|nr:hypothetical protein [Leptolyngbyaceae cyanobacterium MO_188.B28]
MDIYISQKKIRLSPKKAIGKGGEADVFKIGRDTALKVFKPPSHPDYAGMPQAQDAAKDRLALHQRKLPQFPQLLPERVIAPQQFATDQTGQQILGYTMPLLNQAEVLLRYRDRAFRQAIPTQRVIQIFQDLHNTLSKLHFVQIVIGDFNDLNVLVKDTAAYLIDADSFQFGCFPCQMFTARFVDPLLCDPQTTQPILQQAHTPNSDWYAFTVMLMQSLLFVDPYGGLYKPKDPEHRIPHSARPLHRITVFHPDVRYPKPALPYDRLPDDLLHHFHQVFEQDWRGEFPRSLLDTLHWTTCSTCGAEHARPQCPACSTVLAALQSPLTQREQVRGPVTATLMFRTEGVILAASVEQDRLCWIYWQKGEFKREDGSVVLKGELQPNVRWRIKSETTLIGCQGQVIILNPNKSPQRLAVESYGAIAQFDVNSMHRYWTAQGQLLRDTPLGRMLIGDVLSGGNTQIWVGSDFGFGFYRAGELNGAFVFDVRQPGINDRVRLPSCQGQLIHAACTFSRELCWLFLTTHEHGSIVYRCVVISPDGAVVATAQTVQNEDNWLMQLGRQHSLFLDSCPYCAVGNFLLAATDDGVIRIEVQNGCLTQTKLFADTEPFVDASCRLLAAPGGLYVIRSHEIQQLTIAGDSK